MTELPARRLMLVHAHPDDESITNGVTMARYAAEGALVTLVTCTLGEEGEVIPPALAHLAADREDTLGPHRIGELRHALRELGVLDHRFLGGPGRYRDSGMFGTEANGRPGCFWRADVDEAASHLVEEIREVRPQVLVTYDPDGGYGHPDHIQAHRVATRAVELAADPAHRGGGRGGPHRVARVYWSCAARSVVEAGFARLRESGGGPFPELAPADDVPGVVDDAEVAVVIEGTAAEAAAKAAAMRAHATQIVVADAPSGPAVSFALSNRLSQPLLHTEHFRAADGRVPDVPLRDLFAGLPAADGGSAG
ncbi:N-acetyl-1-D-myo-inositol-2-amino-2-deoxy-alpha-D-glucopyranoside deacetylase [Streptomyces sp. TRM 70361]|uniref:N-acetyl-1-D-myo-inositol-2-amino-2-deoxy-alpha- D-glucopyranoside deacetylase n=1 Tax=Streptomyces sp. TRM 70361 TaxID=3116553 RepID=UPI002E7B3A62|nr:N-acetyl-1-D-myo-inositol-2-amino-2-deoxy-alpha-D-glucopyranoside deacetylase [Streptomyces sp. TRM 70361]MEE1939221.1 N-acetyl-1-D-myo-inositol-2-amino-2-deoxy-alpha-D-glucopyranoside deacetylase [Streptomyces sp. TRM 70361]